MRESIEWSFIKGKADDRMISKIENDLGISFPPDYTEYVKRYPNGRPNPNFFKTKNKTTTYEKGGTFEYFYSLDPEDACNILNQYQIINVHSGKGNQVPDGVIPFASASNSDDLCFDYRKGYPPKIVFLDLQFHWDYLAYLEEPEFCKKVTEEDYLIHVCDSFTELLDMLEEEPEDE